jgi:hypothetical protein
MSRRYQKAEAARIRRCLKEEEEEEEEVYYTDTVPQLEQPAYYI